MKSPSFRLKIALLSTAISAAVMIAFGTSALLVISRQKTESLDTRIRSLGGRQPGWLAQQRDFHRFEEGLAFVFDDQKESRPFILQVRDPDGTELYRSSGWPEGLPSETLKKPLSDATPGESLGEQASPPEESSGPGRGRGGRGRGMGPSGGNAVRFTKIPEFLTLETADGSWRIGKLGTDELTLIIGLDTAATTAEINQLRMAFLLALPVALALVGAGGWLVAGQALRPLRSISETAAHVTALGMDRRIPVSDEDPEIRRLIDTLNHMMDRLENAFRQATRFSADASHELKTPLSIMCGELEAALQDAAPGSNEQKLFSSLLDETQRLAAITRSLLLLSRADAGQLVPALEEIDLSAMIEDLLEDGEVLASDAGLELHADIPAGIKVMADPVLLRTALLNLLMNAVKYNQPAGFIRVNLVSNERENLIRFSNSGPGIPPDEQSRIFNRFQRADPSRERRIDGIGLGLSLTREILHTHHGEVELEESRPGMTRFAVRLPRLPLDEGNSA